MRSKAGIRGIVEIVLKQEQEGELVVVHRQVIHNLVTQVGDQYYGERAAGIGSPPAQVTGMKLGTDTTAEAKTGAGAALGAYVTGSNKAISGGFPTSALEGSVRRIQWESEWDPGEATASDIAEAIITNQSGPANDAGSAANTISRVVFDPITKGALDTLTITWSHDIFGDNPE